MRLVSIASAVFAAASLLSAAALADDPPTPEATPPAPPTAASPATTAPPAPPPPEASATPPAATAPPASPVLPPPRLRLVAPRQPPAAAPAPQPPAVPAPAPAPALPPPPNPHEFGDPNVGVDGHPVAGFHGGKFYLRDRYDYFRIYVGGRLHLDQYNYFGPHVSDTALKSTFLLRRARVEVGGEVWGHWQWLLQTEFAPTEFDNTDGTAQQYASKVGTDPTGQTARYAPVQTPRYRAQPVQVYVNYEASPLLNLQIGQINVPFTMENRTSTNTITFLDRSLAVRSWGIPEIRDIGVSLWGNLDKRVVGYAVGLFNGDGYNRPNADNRFLTAGRVFVRPLARGKGPLEKLQIGGSFKYGMHDKNRVAYDAKAMTTQSNYQFWAPTYTDSLKRRVHIIPSGAEMGFGGELRIPFNPIDLRSEFVYLKNNTREAVDGYQLTNTERFGTMKGYGYYVQLSYWLLGSPKIVGDPGDQSPPKVDLDKPDPGIPPQGLELAVKWEQLAITYDSAARSGTADQKNADGDIKVNAFSAGINYWASRHMRLSLDYVYDMFPDSASKTTESQRAQAPGNLVGDDGAHALHELSARVGLAF